MVERDPLWETLASLNELSKRRNQFLKSSLSQSRFLSRSVWGENMPGAHNGGLGGFEDYDVPDIVATSLIGYRSFGPQPVTTMLHGLTKTEYIWQPGANEAVCLRSARTNALQLEAEMKVLHQKEAIPVADCACGFWAYWDINSNALGNSPSRLKGAIIAWGKMIVGPLGFRAQYAKILALSLPEQSKASNVYPGIRAQYPGVKWFDDYHEMAAVFPSNNVFHDLKQAEREERERNADFRKPDDN